LWVQEQLVLLLQRKVDEEAVLKQHRDQSSELDQKARELALQRQNEDRACQSLREALETEKMKRQEQFVRRQTLEEQLDGLELDVDEILASLPENADYAEWERNLGTVSQKILRLGAVNLMAIEEYEEGTEDNRWDTPCPAYRHSIRIIWRHQPASDQTCSKAS